MAAAKPEPVNELAPGLVQRLARPPAYSLGALTPAEEVSLRSKGRVPRIGVHRAIGDVRSLNGKWETLPDGSALWRLTIHSWGAAGIRVQFGNFSAGSGKVWVYSDSGGGQSQGPYTGRGLFDNGEFWSGTLWGESATIEYQPSGDGNRSLPFEVRSIAHRAITGPRSAVRILDGTSTDPAGSCNLDVSCYPAWADAAKMVGEIVFETQEGEDQFEASCSASLVATRDNSLKPYLLTAGHCIDNEPDARTVETFWTYQTSKCAGAVPLLEEGKTSEVGAHYLVSGDLGSGDYSLLLLKNVPGGVLYSGWDTGEVPIGSHLVGIHHPEGSYKRIVFGHRAGNEVALINGQTLPADLYYVLETDKGIAQPGSSGSPLFSAPGVIVGTATYAPSEDGETLCSSGSVGIGYGRFSVAYPNLSNWLEDLPFSEVLPSRTDVSFTGANGVFSGGPSQTVMLTTHAQNAVAFSVRSDAPWIQVSAAASSTSASNPAPLTISVLPKMLNRAGTYVGTLTILSGAAPPQFVNVRADVKIDISNVSASANPEPAYQGSDGLWSYTVTLQESAGADTRVTLLRIDGRDYSNQIVSWFGSDHLAAGGTLQAPLKSRVLGVPATQTVEVGGLDDGSQKNWYRVFTVRLLAGQ